MVPQWGVAGWQQAGVTRILTMLLFILIVINTLKVSTVSRRTQYSEKAPTRAYSLCRLLLSHFTIFLKSGRLSAKPSPTNSLVSYGYDPKTAAQQVLLRKLQC